MSFKRLVKLAQDKETLERMNKRIKELNELINKSKEGCDNIMTDSELYELLRNGIEPEGVEKVSDEEVGIFIEVLESILNDKIKRCPCQTKEEIDKILNE